MSDMTEKLAAEGIQPRDWRPGNHKLTCPRCSAQRRNKSDPCLSLTIDDSGAVWKCHHCSWSGAVNERQREWHPAKPAPVRIAQQPEKLTAEAIAWFAERGISEDALAFAGVGWSARRQAIVFPYRRPGETELSNAKFRRLPKSFSQIKDGAKLYWLVDKLDPGKGSDLFIVEGEMDALALVEAGIQNVVSVPDGAPAEAKENLDQSARKFSFVAECDQWIEPFDRIILAVDNDGNGRALEDELARRYGKDRCWRVVWPSDIKDANEFLIEYGKSALAERCLRPKPYPVEGLFEVDDYEADVAALFHDGRKRGASTGLPSLDELYTVAPGQITIVTGVPNHGKSEFIDQLAVNLARRECWSFGVCSFENDPANHLSKWAEKFLGMPFFDGPTPRMSSGDLARALTWLGQHFHFIRNDGEIAPTVEWILNKARILVKRFGIRGLVIDPYNEIEHKRPEGVTETEYVSAMLSSVKRFAQAHGVHVWFVAHPAKLRTENGKTPVPTLYDISGSANFVNKADCGIAVHRGEEPGTTEIYVRKVRFKWVGQQGRATLGYSRATGVYRDLGMVET